MKEKNFFPFFLYFFLFFLFQNPVDELDSRETSNRLLRIWPSYRPEECDWAIRKFICLRCLKNGVKYAQEIHFDSERRPYRIHGCFSDSKGFFPIPEGRDHPVDF